MKRTTVTIVLAGVFTLSAFSVIARADTPRAAAEIMSAARKEAKVAHKPIFVLFDASW